MIWPLAAETTGIAAGDLRPWTLDLADWSQVLDVGGEQRDADGFEALHERAMTNEAFRRIVATER